MEVKPGYKQTEAGEIPEEWEVDYVGESRPDHYREKEHARSYRRRSISVLCPISDSGAINCYSYDGEAVLTAGDGVGTGKVFHYINGKFDVAPTGLSNYLDFLFHV